MSRTRTMVRAPREQAARPVSDNEPSAVDGNPGEEGAFAERGPAVP